MTGGRKITYRYVPDRWKLVAQLATLLVNAVMGLYIVVTSTTAPDDPRISAIEEAMSAVAWGWVLIGFGLVGFVTELINASTKNVRMYWVVTTCHIALSSVMLAFGVSSMIAVVMRDTTLFAAPTLALYLALMNFVYVQRKPSFPPGALNVTQPR